MNWQLNPFALLLFIAACISAALAVYAWQRRPAPGAVPLALLASGAAIWSMGYAVAMGFSVLSARVFWAKVQYLGITLVPLASFAFVVQYTGRERWLTRRNLALLALIPLAVLALAWTNEAHGLVWVDFQVVVRDGVHVLDLEYGTFFWIYTAYAYLLLSLAVILLVQSIARSSYLRRRQSILILAGLLVPWLGNFVYLSGLNPVPYLDWTPFFYTLSGLILAWGLFRYRLLDIVPIARDRVVESMRDAVIVLDAQGRIIDLNPAAQKLVSLSYTRVMGQPARQVFSGQMALAEQLDDLSETHSRIAVDIDGKPRYYDRYVSPLLSQQGEPTGHLILLHDITERQQAEEALQKSQNRLIEQNTELNKLSQAIRQSANTVVITDLEGNIEYVNPKFVETTGYTSEEALGQNPRILKSGEQSDFFYREMWQTITSGQEWRGEFRNRRKDGSFYWEMASIAPVFDSSGKMTHFIAVKEDITARKETEQALRDRERFMALLSDITRAALETANLPAMLQILSDRLGELFGADGCYLTLWDEETQTVMPSAAYGAWREDYRSVRVEPGERTMTASVLEAGRPLVVEDVYDTPYLSQRIAELFPDRSLLGLPLIAGNQKLGVVLVAYNEPHQFTPEEVARGEQAAAQVALAVAKAQLVETLRQYVDELQSRNEELDAFAHTVAHDLKSPLSNLVGYADVLMEEYAESPDELLRRFLPTIARHGRKIGTIVDELLVLSSVRDLEEIETGPLEMKTIVAEALERLHPMIEQYQAVIVQPSTMPQACGYAPWVEEVWINYISNALKYGGRPPRVELGSDRSLPATSPTPALGPTEPDTSPPLTGGSEGGPAQHYIRFWVRDNGPGLPPEEQTRLFTPFERLHQVRARGHGLGLSIVQRIVHRLGGQVGVESRPSGSPDQGCTFWFTLPALPPT